MEKYQALVDKVGQVTGIDLKMEEGGICAVKLDDIIINMHFIQEEDQCYFFSALFQIPGNASEKAVLFETLLKKNCFYRDTMGGILGIDTELDKVTYAAKFNIAGISGNDFAARIESFINAAEYFVETLNRSDIAHPPQSDSETRGRKEITPGEFQSMIKI
ncbi:MAG: type III secretion system chaperone [Desulfobacterium sp.]|jgi:hypothetical protein|nr:type III secretion system chaperone [Desulfobacterium sp.]